MISEPVIVDHDGIRYEGGSNEVGTAPGTEEEDPNGARGHRGDWGSLWKK